MNEYRLHGRTQEKNRFEEVAIQCVDYLDYFYFIQCCVS